MLRVPLEDNHFKVFVKVSFSYHFRFFCIAYLKLFRLCVQNQPTRVVSGEEAKYALEGRGKSIFLHPHWVGENDEQLLLLATEEIERLNSLATEQARSEKIRKFNKKLRKDI